VRVFRRPEGFKSAFLERPGQFNSADRIFREEDCCAEKHVRVLINEAASSFCCARDAGSNASK
jgi:hypothetical protein